MEEGEGLGTRLSYSHVQRYLALDWMTEWRGHTTSSPVTCSMETVEEWVALSGKQGEG